MSSTPSNSAPTGPTVSTGEAKVLGFLVAGAALVVLADVAPQAAIGMTLVLALGIVLTHTSELTAMSNLFQTATGHPPQGS